MFYFTKMLLPLGEDLYAYSITDIIATIKASGELNFINLSAIAIIFALIFFILGLGKKLPINLKSSLILTSGCYLYLLVFNFIPQEGIGSASELDRNLKVNKSFYLYNQSYNYFTARNSMYYDFFLTSSGGNSLVDKKYVSTEYPFLHENNYPDVLGKFFNEFDTMPDIVFVLIESLGKAYSGKDAYLGSFTPFLDSLENHSLYWKNNLSTTGRTFGILTGTFGSLPFAKNGFMELAPNLPKHLSLMSILKHNGYTVNYHIGADKAFDNVGTFLNYQNVDRILDISSFDPDFKETPSNTGFSWGYPDKAMFENGMRKISRETNQPQLSIFQTQTSHDPYIIPDEKIYREKFVEHLKNTLKIEPQRMNEYLKYTNVYSSIIYTDDAIREFFNAYKRMPNFENTIFIFTGDHRLPEVPMSTRIDRFHTPLMIYSPKLKTSRMMAGVTTHFEITPTILSLLSARYEIKQPTLVAWKGYVLDTAINFQSKISQPLMRNKNQLLEYISGEYVLSDNQLFILSDGMNLDPITDNTQKEKLNREFGNYINDNRHATEFDKIIPDSLTVYMPKN
ncbi:LTA synthase family protein [Belliella sp. R4-6]|uniref:LTA synthase family protein n=1 Tax=Belliella alkalica TaxID=1730871 RepID=A0ABS9VGI3_9BACT|nr:LTA synthase family protein [Belliella alkalica]MCH7415542.1 LTA synthase family protein [Belliella alkalica]